MATTTKLTPKRLAIEAKRALRAAAKYWPPRRADTFFKPGEEVLTVGIGAPRLKQIERKLFNATRKSWTAVEAAEFAETLLAEKYIEGRSVGLMMLSRFYREYDPNLLARARGWLASRRCDNWALTDLLSTKVLAPLLQQYPDLAPRLRDWGQANSLWVRRAALAALVPLARRGQQLALAYGLSAAMFDDRDDLVHKAAGWLLRECGKTNPRRLEAYLCAHGPRIPRTTLRYAIERFPAPKREEILDKTRDGTEAVSQA